MLGWSVTLLINMWTSHAEFMFGDLRKVYNYMAMYALATIDCS